MILEYFSKLNVDLPKIRSVLDCDSLINGLVAAIFAVTGPVAIILSVASAAELENDIINTWIFAAFGIGGLLTVILSVLLQNSIST